MQKLESLLGVPLFDRSNSRIALNETGEVDVQYAQKVLNADRELAERTIAFDRSRRTLVLGACASLPLNLILPVLQERFRGMALTSEIARDDRLLSGLQNRTYQLVLLHEVPSAPDLFVQPFLDERLCITIPANHPLAGRTEVSFRELDGMSILAHRNAAFWVEICRQNLPHSTLLAQDNLEILHELVDSSTLPAFSSDRAVERGCVSDGRVTIPIRDPAAYATYYLACLHTEKTRFRPVFDDINSAVYLTH